MIKSKKLKKIKYLKHGFFNRVGGKSKNIYKSLNCGPSSKDLPSNVKKNLQIVKKKINRSAKNIYLSYQVHSNKFIYINNKYRFKTKPRVDAIITNQRNLPIAVLTADCAPVLICDNDKNMIAAIHAGWKGAYKNIIKKVINFMIKKGCNPENMTAAVGPCIAVNNYEIKQDFIKKFLKKDKKNKIFFKKYKNKNCFNLNKYIYIQLQNLNVKNIDLINKDTFNEKNNFFSARRSIGRNENDYGRNISVIMIN